MSVRFGYACLNVTLGRKGGFRSMIKRTWLDKGLPHASRIALENAEILQGIVEWNNQNGFKLYRMSSSMFPWGSEYELTDLPEWNKIQEIYENVGEMARKGGQRLTFHPGQFNCLTSPREHVVQNCIRDLRLHGELMDVMGMPRTPESKINIHLGGSFGDRDSAIDRWCKNFERLPESVKSRLTVENDDKAGCFSAKDLYRVWQRTGVPTVFDYHHHKFCDGGLHERDALHLAVSTWPVDIRPVTHYSESAKHREGRDVAATAHSNFVDGPVNDWGLDVDCVVEAKAKELAVIQLTTGKRLEDQYDEARGCTNEELNEMQANMKAKKKAAKLAAKGIAA